MSASLVSVENDTITVEFKVKLGRSMLESEEAILAAVNEGGCIATRELLKRFDTDGTPLVLGGEKWTSKGQVLKAYQTPYGEIEVARHVYQRARGGKTFCPLERDARIVVTSTPRFARVVGHKMAMLSSPQVARDLAENHGRAVARSYVQNLAEAVGRVVQAKEELWHYTTPRLAPPVASVAVGLDGTCMLLCEEGSRQAMVGTVSLYDAHGERQHTIYLGATPEYGRARFLARLEREITPITVLYPNATYVGVADGAPENWTFLQPHVSVQVVDFYHTVKYLG